MQHRTARQSSQSLHCTHCSVLYPQRGLSTLFPSSLFLLLCLSGERVFLCPTLISILLRTTRGHHYHIPLLCCAVSPDEIANAAAAIQARGREERKEKEWEQRGEEEEKSPLINPPFSFSSLPPFIRTDRFICTFVPFACLPPFLPSLPILSSHPRSV